MPGARRDDRPLRWAKDGRSIFVRSGVEMPARVERVEIATGRRVPWKELRPADPAEVLGIENVLLTPDARSYASRSGR